MEMFNVTIVESSIAVSPDAFPQDTNGSYLLNLYNTPVLFPILQPDSVNVSAREDVIADTQVIGFSIPGQPNITNISVNITLQSLMGRVGIVSMHMAHYIAFPHLYCS